ncbi:MAG: C39 family peptidase [Tepidisphaeraceae bacterium]
MEPASTGTGDVSRSGAPPGIDVPPAVIERARELYDSGLMIQAYEASRATGPLRDWKPVSAGILAARLARNIGAPRLGRAMIRRAYLTEPANPLTRYYRAGELIGRRGPFAAWEFMRQFGTLDDAEPAIRADWMAYLAEIAWSFRDFDAADSLMARAVATNGQTPWLCVMQARSLEAQDRYEEALVSARHSLELRAWFSPGVQMTAHVLQLLDRDDEALAMLAEASNQIESGLVVWQLAALRLSLEHFDDARDSLDRVEKLMPLMEPAVFKALAGMRSEVSYHRGDTALAIDWARKSQNKFLAKVLDCLAAAPPQAKRARLTVPFVRQHHSTCAPATLATISRFWSMPVDLRAVIDEICYNGTPLHLERQWAIDHGWATCEFTVTWDAAKALIDRGVPFTLTTPEVTTSHLQAVVGYDERRRTLLVRDPFQYYQSEFHADLLFKRYSATGPRGMALVPGARADLLDGLNLPDAALHDRLFELWTALEKHDRAAAQRSLDAMNAQAPDHWLPLIGAKSLAQYDGDPAAELQVVDRWLEKFPDDAALKFLRASLLRSLGRRDLRLQELENICSKGATDPVFYQELANDLALDAREHARSIRLLRKALRRQPRSGASLHALAGIYWANLDREKAMELYRFAACLEDKNESAAQSYFAAGRNLRKTDEAMAMLRSRFERFGDHSAQPAMTLFGALDAISQLPQAMAVLEESQRRRPDDGDLILYAARNYARHGGNEKAKSLLNSAKGKTHAVNWLRSAATLASYEGNLTEALGLWRQVLQTQPLAMDAHEAVARLTAETESTAAALEYLESACTRFPHFFPLMRLRIDWLRRDGAEAAEPAVRALVEQRPNDVWARRELALVLVELRRYEQAAAEAAMALRLEPTSPGSHFVQGLVFSRLNRTDEARDCWRQCIRLSVDYRYAIDQLLGSCTTIAQRREALRFVHSGLVRQVVFGDGLLAYRQQASNTLQPQELLDDLRAALSARPDLWHAWSAVIGQLATMDQLPEAMELAQQATDRFALIPRIWLDMSYVCRLRGDRQGEIETLHKCLGITPGWSIASRQLASALVRDGNLRQARRVMKDAIARDPLDGSNHATLSDLLWRMNKRRGAVVYAKRAVFLAPELQSTWDDLRRWTAALKRPQEAVELARQVALSRAGEPQSWLLLAKMLSGPATLQERLAACEKALSLNRRSIEATDLQARLLCEAKRFDEALAACQSPAWGDSPPVYMRGRAAWVVAERADVPAAIEQMRSILREDPNYYWGWQTLCRWLQVHKNGAEFLEAAGEMAKYFPNDLGALNQLARAQICTGHRLAGKATYARVLAISPLDDQAGFHLFDAQLVDREFDAAAATLQLLLKHQDGPWARQREIALTTRRGDKQRLAWQLSQASKWVLTDPAPFDAAIKEIDKAGPGKLVDLVLLESLDKCRDQPPTADEARLAQLAVERAAKARNWPRCRQLLRKFESRDSVWLAAVVPYIDELGSCQRRLTIRHFLWKHRQKLKRDTLAWGTMGYALLRGVRLKSQYQKVVEWLADYASRPDARPWMLWNLSIGLRCMGWNSEAYAASRHALGLLDDQTTPYHVITMAMHELIESSPGEGVKRFPALNKRALPDRHRFLAQLVEALWEFERQLPTSPQAAATAARNMIAEARASYAAYYLSLEQKRTFRRVVWSIARKAGGWRMRLWAIYRSM